MKLTVLGMYAPYPPAGGATSGYLLQGGECNILLDCGSGALSRLQRFIDADVLSRENGVKRLLLTHFLAHYPPGGHVEEARRYFENVQSAAEMQTCEF